MRFVFISSYLLILYSSAYILKFFIEQQAVRRYDRLCCSSFPLIVVHAPVWLKHLLADGIWISFVQKNVNDALPDDIFRIGQQILKLDPHFTVALRLLLMSLIFYKKEYSLAYQFACDVLQSKINQADWRLYSYLLMIQTHKATAQLQKISYSLGPPCRIVRYELPEMPSYIAKLIA